MTGEVIYNTGNAVPSEDAYDRRDNSRVFDSLLNGDWPTVTSRTGKILKSWEGLEQDIYNSLLNMGYETLHLTYVNGSPLQVDRPTQLIDRAGSVYKVKMPASFPLTLSGTWATDQALLVDVGDQSLRTELKNGTPLLVDSGVTSYRGRSVKARLDDLVNVMDDHGAPGGGAKGDGVTDDYAAIIAARDFAILTGRRTLIFPQPTVSYAVSQMLELAVTNNFRSLGIGFPTIKYIGTAPALAVVSLDYSVGGGRFGIGFENFNLQGTANVQHALYTRAINWSNLANIRGWDCVNSGIMINSGVCNKYENLRCLSAGGIAGAPNVKPASGLRLDQQGVGDQVSWCTFVNVIMEEATGYGIRIDSGNGNLFLGGTSESNNSGIYTSPTSWGNTFQNIDFEANLSFDTVINGNTNNFIGCNSLSTASTINHSIQGAEGTTFTGCNLRSVDLQASSHSTKFFGCRFSDNGALGIQGAGTYQSYGCVREDNAGVITVDMPDKILRLSLGGPPGSAATVLAVQGIGSTSATDCFRFLAGGSGTILLQGRNDGVLFSPATYALTTASGGNVFIGSDGSLARSTSAMKYKTVEGPVSPEAVAKFLAIAGFRYWEKGKEGGTLYYGFSADAFHEAGLHELVHYGAEGEVEGLQYERITVFLREIAVSQQAQIDELSRKLDAVLERLGN